MFAPSQNPHTQTTHLHRTYQTHHTTSKKNLNKENSHAPLPSKTPSRQVLNGKALLNTGLRTGLGVKTAPRDGNVVHDSEGLDKGKGKMGDDIGPKRLFASTSKPTSSKTTLPPSKSLSQMPYIHQTPAPIRQKAQNLQTPAPTPLPSATRTRRRSKQSLSHTPIRNSESTQSFVTPQPSGVRWEEGDSLGSVELGGVVSLEGVVEELDEGSEGEVEYMPDEVEERPYEPPYEHANLTEVFKGFSKAKTFDVARGRRPKDEDLSFSEVVVVEVKMRPDEELEEPMFRKKPVPPPAISNPKSVGFARPAPIRPGKLPLPSHRLDGISATARPKPPLLSTTTAKRSAMPPIAKAGTRIVAPSTRLPSSSKPVPVKETAIPQFILDMGEVEMPVEQFSLDI